MEDLEARAVALEPRLALLEAQMDRDALEAAVAALPALDESDSLAVRRYVEARLRLAIAIVDRFERDHEITTELAPDRQANISTALAQLDPVLDAGVGESEHYRVYSDLYAMRIDTILDGMRWGSGLLSALDEAERLDPENRWVEMSRGKRRLFAPTGLGRDLDRSEAHFRRAAELDPTWAAPHLFLAEVSIAREDLDRARTQLEHALRLRPDHRFARIVLSRLEETDRRDQSHRVRPVGPVSSDFSQSEPKRGTGRKVDLSLTPETTFRGIRA